MALTITTLPDPPSRSEPTTFSVKCDAFLGALPGFVSESNALADEVETHASEADLSATNAAASETNAAISAAAADASAADAAAAVNATMWISGTTYALGDLVWSPTDYFTYRRIIAGAGTTDPSSDATNWALVYPFKHAGTGVITFTSVGATNVTLPTSGSLATLNQVKINRTVRTSNVILAAGNVNDLIDVTSGTFTQTFTAAATLGDGWHVFYRNSGSGEIALDPNGSETIDGLTTFKLYPGEMRLIQCNGTAFISKLINAFYLEITSTTTFIVPPGYSTIMADCLGGGGGGRRGLLGNTTGAPGGGGGGRIIMPVHGLTAGGSVTITIGAGGAGATSDDTNGTDGGDSSFGAYVVATGGLAGKLSTGGAGGAGGVAHTNVSDALGYAGAGAGYCAEWGGGAGSSNSSNPGGSSIYGAGGGGGGGNSFADMTGGAGGASNSYTPGGGGAGGATNSAGTNGADGTNEFCGSGGGGGGGGTIGTAGKGGNGGFPGGGGGGGGAMSAGGTATGNGGNGGNGLVRVWGIV